MVTETWIIEPLFKSWQAKVDFINNKWDGRKHLRLKYSFDPKNRYHPHVLEVETTRWLTPQVVDDLWTIFHEQLKLICLEQFGRPDKFWFFNNLRARYIIDEKNTFRFKHIADITLVKMLFDEDRLIKHLAPISKYI